MSDLKFLATVDVLQDLTEKELELVGNLCRRAHWEKDDVVFTEGHKAENMAFVISGQIDLRYKLPGRPMSKETTLSTIMPGGAFGWSAFVPPYRYTLTSHAVGGPCNAYMLNNSDLQRLFEENPRVGYIFMRNLASLVGQRFNDAQDDLARLHGFELTSEG